MSSMTMGASGASNSQKNQKSASDEAVLMQVAQSLVQQGFSKEECINRLSAAFPQADEFAIRAAIVIFRERQTSGAEAPAPASEEEPGHELSPHERQRAERIARLQEAPRAQFAAAVVPAEALAEGSISVPVEFVRYSAGFSVSRLPSHTFKTRDKQDREVAVTVGDGDEHPSLDTEHQRLKAILYSEAHRCGLSYCLLDGEQYMAIKTSFPRLYGQSCGMYGGSGQKRVETWLNELEQTPVVYEIDGQRVNQPFIYAWKHEPNSGDNNNVTIYLHPRWSALFAPGRESERKPLLLREYLTLSSPYARMMYLHLDWALSKHGSATMLMDTVLERGGAFHDSQESASILRKSRSQRLQRTRSLWQLDGLQLSCGLFIKMSTTEVPCKVDSSKTTVKFVFERIVEEQLKALQTGKDEAQVLDMQPHLGKNQPPSEVSKPTEEAPTEPMQQAQEDAEIVDLCSVLNGDGTGAAGVATEFQATMTDLVGTFALGAQPKSTPKKKKKKVEGTYLFDLHLYRQAKATWLLQPRSVRHPRWGAEAKAAQSQSSAAAG